MLPTRPSSAVAGPQPLVFFFLFSFHSFYLSYSVKYSYITLPAPIFPSFYQFSFSVFALVSLHCLVAKITLVVMLPFLFYALHFCNNNLFALCYRDTHTHNSRNLARTHARNTHTHSHTHTRVTYVQSTFFRYFQYTFHPIVIDRARTIPYPTLTTSIRIHTFIHLFRTSSNSDYSMPR